VRLILSFGLCILLAGFLYTAQAGDDYDNPSMGSTPCITVDTYRVREVAGGALPYKVDAILQNICGRSVELSLCLVYVTPVEGVDRSCYGSLVRPGSRAQILGAGVPVRVSRPEYSWRYIN